MASANSLLGLVNQLQSMEHHFTSILLETILKLTSLTDAKVFVLVEGQDCRRFAGAEYLCQSFADGALQPVSSDVQVHLQPEVSALREEPLSPSSNPSSDTNLHVTSIHSTNGDAAAGAAAAAASQLSSNRKRHHVGGQRPGGRPVKERKLIQAFKRDPDIGAFNSSDLSVFECSADGAFGAEALLENGFASTGESKESGDDFPVEDDSFASIIFSKPATVEVGGGAAPNNHNAVVPAQGDGVEAAPSTNHDYSFIDEFMRTNPKVGPVLSIYDDSVTEKNSVSNKVTLSLVYDFAKCLFSNCSYASFKDWGFREFFEMAFERFWQNFPNFAAWEENNMRFQERVDKRTNICRMATPKSFLRQKIRINVINLMLTKIKPNQGSKITKKSLPFF